MSENDSRMVIFLLMFITAMLILINRRLGAPFGPTGLLFVALMLNYALWWLRPRKANAEDR